jgi:hypothetical protein
MASQQPAASSQSAAGLPGSQPASQTAASQQPASSQPASQPAASQPVSQTASQSDSQSAQPAASQSTSSRPASQPAAFFVVCRIKAIDESGYFDNLSTLMPLPLKEGGHIAPFAHDEYIAAMKSSKKYTCGGLLSWCNWTYNTAPTVPILSSSVSDLGDAKYKRRQGTDAGMKDLTLVIGMKSYKDQPQRFPFPPPSSLTGCLPPSPPASPHIFLVFTCHRLRHTLLCI